jgi:hypothetical protein
MASDIAKRLKNNKKKIETTNDKQGREEEKELIGATSFVSLISCHGILCTYPVYNKYRHYVPFTGIYHQTHRI